MNTPLRILQTGKVSHVEAWAFCEDGWWYELESVEDDNYVTDALGEGVAVYLIHDDWGYVYLRFSTDGETLW